MASGKRNSQPIRLALSSKFNVEPIAQIDMTPPHSRRSREYLRLIASKSRIGRVKRAVKREFILSDGKPILTRKVLERAYPRLSRFTWWHYLAARRALRQEAIVVGRNRFGRGRPNLWALRHDAT